MIIWLKCRVMELSKKFGNIKHANYDKFQETLNVLIIVQAHDNIIILTNVNVFLIVFLSNIDPT